MSLKKIRGISVVAGAVLSAGCATAPGGPNGNAGNQIRQIFASDDPCSNNSRNIGIASGVVVGTILGKALGDGKSGALIAGAAVGGLVGGLIGADLDRKRCELAKVARQYDLDMTFSTVHANGEVLEAGGAQNKGAGAAGTERSVIGSTVMVRDKDGTASHFESGSDRLTPRAREYFSAISAQYSPQKLLDGQTDAKRRDDLGRQLAQRRLFLVGHTDDTGSSELNAVLSERRAKAVASFLRQHGVSEGSLYFQGAGETLPVADNRTDAGRATNRREEIVELADEAGFKKYLEARKASHEFYRPAAVASRPANIAGKLNPEITAEKSSRVLPEVARIEKQANAVTSGEIARTQARLAVAAAPAIRPPVVNFGGVPYSPQGATLKVGAATPEKSGFSFVSKAYADDAVVLADCTRDRPRTAGSIKSLRDGSIYKTSEHFPQLYGKTWAGDVNGNLVVINRLSVLRDGGPANLPELKVYAQYKPSEAKKPEVNEEPRVNSYLVGQGVLYRIFPRGDAGLKCMDLLFSTDGATTAKGGKLIYTAGAADFVADFKPQLQ